MANTAFTFVIDTDSYAGNFCREMCAYMTGVIGECGVGQEQQMSFLEEMDITEDEFADGKSPFCTIVDKADGSAVQELIGQRPDEHGIRRPSLLVSNIDWRNDGVGNHKKISEINDDEKQKWSWPAFLSVGIILNSDPEIEQINLMKKRALNFAEMNDIKIEGFRIVSVVKVETSKRI